MTDDYLDLTRLIVGAYVTHHDADAAELSDLIVTVHTALRHTAEAPVPAPVPTPARRAVAKAPRLKKVTPPPVEKREDRQAEETPELPAIVAPAPVEAAPAPAPEPEAAKPERKRLSLKLVKVEPAVAAAAEPESATASESSNPEDVLALAVRQKRCVRFRYNQTEMLVAPLVLYVERDEFYVDGVALEKNGVPPRYEKLGRFKLAGLSTVSLSPKTFSPAQLNVTREPRPGERVIAGI